MKYNVPKKQGKFPIITKSPNQYPNIKAQISNEIQPLENYENNTVVFDEMLLSKQEINIDLFFTRGRHQKIDVYYISQSYSQTPKIIFVTFLILIFYLNNL